MARGDNVRDKHLGHIQDAGTGQESCGILPPDAESYLFCVNVQYLLELDQCAISIYDQETVERDYSPDVSVSIFQNKQQLVLCIFILYMLSYL